MNNANSCRRLIAAASALVLCAATPARSPAGASFLHPHLEASDPEQDAVLESSPERVWLLFSEKINAKTSRIQLQNDDVGKLTLRVAGDPDNDRALLGQVPMLAPGRYVVEWFVVGADGHPASGKFGFRIAEPDSVRQ